MNTFGNRFKVSIYGESHGKCVGSLIDFIPHGIALKEEDFEYDMARRNPNLKGTTPRKDNTIVEIMSGVFEGFTTGQPVNLQIQNRDTIAKDYDYIKNNPRPGHADLVAKIKYEGYNDYRGGGSFSGRLTAALVAAGVVAKKLITNKYNVSINSRTYSIGGEQDYKGILKSAIKANDSLGGIVECSVKGLPIGIGEPYFQSFESVISQIIFSVPGIKGIEFGDGFKAADMCGSEYNDSYIDSNGRTESNHSGGINGGISNGNELYFRIAARPTSTIGKPQKSYDFEKNVMSEISYAGRHDVCFALRLPVIVEAVTAIAIADLISY
jgi:chorismate synthase